jgi:signal transduction histidine kinase
MAIGVLVAAVALALIDAPWGAYVVVAVLAVVAVVRHVTLLSAATRHAVDAVALEDPEAPERVGDVAEAVRRRVASERLAAERQSADLRAALLASGVGVLVVARDGSVLTTAGATAELVPAGAEGTIRDPALLRLFASALDRGEPAIGVSVMGVRNRVMQWIAMPLDEDAVGAVVTDVSEVQRVQAMRRNFVTDASHELKTPIAAIQAAAEALQTAIGNDDDRSLLFARRLEEQAVRLGRIVNDLLDLSRLEAGEPEMGPVDLTSVVRTEVGLAEADAAIGRVSLSAELEQVEVTGSRADLGLAVRNLITNAIRYTPEGGQVRVAVRLDGALAVVEVTDSGIGIAASDQERVFERFFRVDSARSRATGGTGLGLSIVRHVVHHHGGSAEVESVSGKGSTFRLVLPRRQP